MVLLRTMLFIICSFIFCKIGIVTKWRQVCYFVDSKGGGIMSKQERLSELEKEYDVFIQTEDGREWQDYWRTEIGSDDCGDFGDYLYDFYTEMVV